MKISLGNIIDAIDKHLGRIKTIGILVLLVLFVTSIVRFGCDRAEMDDMLEKITGLNLSNDILREDVKERDSLLVAKENRILALKDSLASSEVRVGRLESDYSHLQADFEHLSDSLLTIPADTSYEFLVNEAYPYPGHLKYPFNEPQVKGIHLTFLENIKMDEINTNLLAQLDEKDNQLDLKDTVVYETQMAMMVMKENRLAQDSIILNQENIIGIQGKQIKKDKFWKRFFQIATATLTAVLTGFIIGSG